MEVIIEENPELLDVPAVYNYHPDTKVLVSTTMADPDPLEPGNWLVPAFATLTAPPVVSEHEVPVFDEAAQSWTTVLLSSLEASQGAQPPLTLDEQKAQFSAFVDYCTDALTRAVLGERSQEYLEAEAQAKAYVAELAAWVDAGGNLVDDNPPEPEVPDFVASWAEAAQMSPSQAADDILANAAAWRAALGQLRRIRLKAKQSALRASDFPTLSAVAAQWDTDYAELRNNLGA